MKPIIVIRLTRIYFEQFDKEKSDAQSAWEAAAIGVIEDAGFEADVETHVSDDPAIHWYIKLGKFDLAWDNGIAQPNISNVSEQISDELCEACDADECYSRDEICALLANLLPILAERGRQIALAACDAGYEAAAALNESE